MVGSHGVCHDLAMSGRLKRVVWPLVSGTTYRRWAYLILGGALLVPYALAGTVLVTLLDPDAVTGPASVPWLPGTLGVVPLIVATAFIPLVRSLEASVATTLLGGPIAQPEIGPARSWPTRWRTAGWFGAHLVVGFVVCLLTMIMLTEAFVLAAAGLMGGFASPSVVQLDAWYIRLGAGAPLLALVVVAVLVYVVAAAGALMARLAPVLLGPSPVERVVAAEQRAAVLAQRNRLARELHDSVGHALSIVNVQAAAASRVVGEDPELARQALDAIGESARGAMADLDHVLGLLREETASTAPQPTLADLDTLLDRALAAGIGVHAEMSGPLGDLPQAVSREAYRIVQEGLTNAVRHAGTVPIALRLDVGSAALELEMVNELTGEVHADRGAAHSGRRGLDGVRERVAALRGEMRAGVVDGHWRLAVTLPLRSRA